MSGHYKILFIVASITGFGVLLFFFWIQFSRFHTDIITDIEIHNHQEKKLQSDQVLNLMLWNISYGGMPSEIDFFYSGGSKLMIREDVYKRNINEILKQINEARDSADFIFLHKVDTSSKRSYFDHQFEKIKQTLPEFESSFCLNFSVPYIPVPLDQPIGEVHSGMLTLAKYGAVSSYRIPLNSRNYYWPKRLFTAQKCMSLSSYSLEKNQLHLINVHLSSYDFEGTYRLAQLKQIWQIADSLEKRGDYVIVAGGWNMNPPGFKKYRIKNGYLGKPAYPQIDSTKYFINWKFEYRMDLPTSRDLRNSYRHGAIGSTIKDFFICSPNISILEVNTVNQKFKNADHQAVSMSLFLMP